MTMSNLLLGGTMPDQAPLVNDVGTVNPLMWCLIMIYIILAGLTVMNMLIGVLCEVVSVVSAVEKEALAINFVESQLLQLMQRIGVDVFENDRISMQIFRELMELPDTVKALQGVGVDVIALFDYTEFFFQSAKELSFPEFMDVILQLRGSNTATVKDIVDLRKLVVNEFDRFDVLVERLGVDSARRAEGFSMRCGITPASKKKYKADSEGEAGRQYG